MGKHKQIHSLMQTRTHSLMGQNQPNAPAGAGPLRHGVGLAGEPLPVLLEVAPVLGAGQAACVYFIDVVRGDEWV